MLLVSGDISHHIGNGRGAKLSTVKKKRKKEVSEISLNAPIYTRKKFDVIFLLDTAKITVEPYVLLGPPL